MRETGEKYTVARRALIAERDTHRNLPLLRETLTPGTVTAAVSGDGMTNWAFLLPGIVDLVEKGHPLLVADHDSGQRGLWTPGSPLDIVAARGHAGPRELARLLDGEAYDELEELIGSATNKAWYFKGPMVSAEWQRAAAECGEVAPIIYVQDIQVDYPLADYGLPGGSRSGVDAIPDQAAGLHLLARKSGAIVALGHCMPAELREGWEILIEHTDTLFVIDSELHETDDEIADGVVRVFRQAVEQRSLSVKLDYHPTGWRMLTT